MKEIGSWSVRQDLLFIPAQIKRLDHVQHAYKCKPMKVTRLSRLRYLKHRWLTVTAQLQSLLTLSIKSMNWKYQPNDWQKMGLPVTRQDIINWQTKSTEYYFELLYQLLKEKLLEQKFLHADETTYRVLESETVKTFYWTFYLISRRKNQLLYIIMIHIAVVNWPKLP